jgi:hypothetical protein
MHKLGIGLVLRGAGNRWEGMFMPDLPVFHLVGFLGV